MPRSILLWALTGLGVGAFWLTMAFVFFTAPQSIAVDVVKGVAALTYPPFLFSDLFLAPLLNAILYGMVAFLWLRIRPRREPH